MSDLADGGYLDAGTPERPVWKAGTPRIGHRMRELQAIVSAMPGCSRADTLRAAGLPLRGPGVGRALNRAIAAGLIVVEHERANLCRLFASERDRRRWHLVREIMMPGIPAERVAEIRAEVAVLDAESAATWSIGQA